MSELVLFTFTNDSPEKIIAGTKCATTRLPSTHWRRVAKQVQAGEIVDAHLWKGSPRNPRSKPALLWRAKLVRAVVGTGAQFTGEMILKDGFQSREEFALRLAAHYFRAASKDVSKAVAWFNENWWVWFEWENPPAIVVRGGTLVEVPLGVYDPDDYLRSEARRPESHLLATGA